MMLLVAGLALFIGSHVLPTFPALRTSLIDRFGAQTYKIAFSVISVLGLVLIVIGYWPARAEAWQIWTPPDWTRHLTFLLMLAALILLAASVIPSRIRDVARHPMLVAIKLWALAHLLVNGDGASFLLFGSLLAYAVYDRISVKRRAALGPLGDKTGTWRGDVIALAAGVAFYAFMLFWGHGALIGVALIGA
jgi:uncharacterized membrane protein